MGFLKDRRTPRESEWCVAVSRTERVSLGVSWSIDLEDIQAWLLMLGVRRMDLGCG